MTCTTRITRINRTGTIPAVLTGWILLFNLPGNALAADNTPPAGITAAKLAPETLTVQWWQWARPHNRTFNPLRDRTGEYCEMGQQGPVWFLAGGFGSSKIRRTCTVPAGKSLFFPVINMAYWQPKNGKTYSCKDTKAAAALNNEAQVDLFAEINGVPIPDIKHYRITTRDCFDIFGKPEDRHNTYTGYPAASDGYWILLDPLPPGRHVLKFGGRYNNLSSAYGNMVQDIEYTITVK